MFRLKICLQKLATRETENSRGLTSSASSDSAPFGDPVVYDHRHDRTTAINIGIMLVRLSPFSEYVSPPIEKLAWRRKEILVISSPKTALQNVQVCY